MNGRVQVVLSNDPVQLCLSVNWMLVKTLHTFWGGDMSPFSSSLFLWSGDIAFAPKDSIAIARCLVRIDEHLSRREPVVKNVDPSTNPVEGFHTGSLTKMGS